MQDFQNIQKIMKRELKHYPELLNNLAVLSGQMVDVNKTPTIHINGKWTSTKLNGSNWVPLTSEENMNSSQPNFISDTPNNIYSNVERDYKTDIPPNFRRDNRAEISGNSSGIILSHDKEALRSDMSDTNPVATWNNVRPYIPNKTQKGNQGEIAPNSPERIRNNTQPDILRNVPEHILNIIRDGSPRRLPEDIKNDIRSTPSNIPKHFENNTQSNIPRKSPENNIRNDISSDVSRNMQPDNLNNIQYGTPRYAPELTRNNIQADIQQNGPDYIQNKFRVINPRNLPERIQNDTQGNVPRNKSECIQNNLRNGISSNNSENIQNNIQSTIADIENNNQYLRFISKRIRNNNQEGAQCSLPERIEIDIRGKIPRDVPDYIRHSNPRTLPDQNNIRSNISRITQIDPEHIRNNLENGIPPANIQSDTQKNFPPRFRDRIEEDIRSNSHVPEYIQKNFRNCTPRSIPNNHQNNIRGSIPRKIQNNSQNNPQDDVSRNVPGHIQNDIRDNSPRNIPKHIRNDFQDGIPCTLPEDIQSNIRHTILGNVAKPINNIRNSTLGTPEKIRNRTPPRLPENSQELSRMNAPRNKLEINQKNNRHGSPRNFSESIRCNISNKDPDMVQKQLRDDVPAKVSIYNEDSVDSSDSSGTKCNSIPLNVFPIGGYSFPIEGFPKLISIHNTYKGNLTTFRVDQIEHFGQNEKDLAEKKESATCSKSSLCLLCHLKNKPTSSSSQNDQTGMLKIRKNIESERVAIQNNHYLNEQYINQLQPTNKLPPYKVSNYQPINTNNKPHYTSQTTLTKPPPPYETPSNTKKIQANNSLDQLITKNQPSSQHELEPPALIDMRTGCSLHSEIDYANFVMGRLIEHHNSVFGEKNDQNDNITIDDKDKNIQHKTNVTCNSPSTTKSTKIDEKTMGISTNNKTIDKNNKKANNDITTTIRGDKTIDDHNTIMDRSIQNINEANLQKVINNQTNETGTSNNAITNLSVRSPMSSDRNNLHHDSPTSTVDTTTTSALVSGAMRERSKKEELKNNFHEANITDDNQKNGNEPLSDIDFNEVGLYIPCLLKKAKSRNDGTKDLGFAEEDLPEIKKSVYDFIKELESAVVGQNSQYKPAVIGQIPADMRPKSATVDFEKTQIDFVKSPALPKESEESKKTTNTAELTPGPETQKQVNQNITVDQRNNNNKKDENLFSNESKNKDKVQETINAKPKKVRTKQKRMEIEDSRYPDSDKSDGEELVDEAEHTSDYLLQMNYFQEIDRRRKEMLQNIDNRQKSQQATEKINMMKDLKESNDLIEKRLMKTQNKASYKNKNMRVKQIEENLESLRQVEDALKTLEEIEVEREVDDYLNKDKDSMKTILEEEAIVNKIISMDNEDNHKKNEKEFTLSKQHVCEDSSFKQKNMIDKKGESKSIESYTKATSSSKKSITIIDSSERIKTNDFVHRNKNDGISRQEQIEYSANTIDSTEKYCKNDSDKTDSTEVINQPYDTHENTELRPNEDRKQPGISADTTVHSNAKTETNLVDTTNKLIEENSIEIDKGIQNNSKESNVETNHNLNSQQEIKKDEMNCQQSSTVHMDHDQDVRPKKSSKPLNDDNYEPLKKKYKLHGSNNATLLSNNKEIDVSSDGNSNGGEVSHLNIISLPDDEQTSNKLDLYSKVLMSIFENTKLMSKDDLSEHHSTAYENIVYNVLNSTIANIVPLINNEANKRDGKNQHKAIESTDTSGESEDDTNSNVFTDENNLIIDEESSERRRTEYGKETEAKRKGDYFESKEEITNHEMESQIRRTENVSESEEDDMLEIDIRENKECESGNNEITEYDSVTHHEVNTLYGLSYHKDSICYEENMPLTIDKKTGQYNENNVESGNSSRSNLDQEDYDGENFVPKASKDADHEYDIEYGESSENDSLQESHAGYELNDSLDNSGTNGYEGGSENDSLQYNDAYMVAIRNYAQNEEDAGFEGKMTESDSNKEIIVYEAKNDKNSPYLKDGKEENISSELKNEKNNKDGEMQYKDEFHLNTRETKKPSEKGKSSSSSTPIHYSSGWVAKNTDKEKNSKKIVSLYESIFLTEENDVTTKFSSAKSPRSSLKGFEEAFSKLTSVDGYKRTNESKTSDGPSKRETFSKTINGRTLVNNYKMIIKQENKFGNKAKQKVISNIFGNVSGNDFHKLHQTKSSYKRIQSTLTKNIQHENSMNLETMEEILESIDNNVSTSELKVKTKTTRPCFVKLIDFQKRHSSQEVRIKTDEDYDDDVTNRGKTSKIGELSSPHPCCSGNIFNDKEDLRNFFGESSKSSFCESSQSEDGFEPNKKKMKMWKCMRIEENDTDTESEEQIGDRKGPTVNPLKFKLMHEKWKNIFG